MRRKRNIKKVLQIIIVLLVLIVAGGIFLYYFQNGKSATSEFPSGWVVEDYDSYMDEKKEIASDIEGMSQYDKYEMGLDYQDGSDTDKDGLTDKEEIEIYSTDPLKASTADDLYTDGYKIENGMDPFTKYEYEDSIAISDGGCSEVILTCDEPSDLNASVKDVTEDFDLNSFDIDTIYKGYWINGYNGAISIDLSNILTQYKMSLKGIRIWIVEGAFVTEGLTELEKCKYEPDGNVVTLDYDFKGNGNYHIFVTCKKRISVGSIFTSSTSSTVKETPDEVDCLLYGSSIATEFGHKKFTLEYTGADDESSKSAFLESWQNNYKSRFGEEFYYDVEVKAVSEASIRKKHSSFQRSFPFMETNFGEPTEIYMLVFVYVFEENIPSSITAQKEENSDFDIFTDELPFQNFSSYIGEYGNCAGITHLTAYLYNNSKLPSSGSYDCTVDGKDKTIKWNLTEDKENKTLTNLGLYDYKTTTFIDENSDNGSDRIGSNLSEGEEEFVNMIGCFWAEGNDKIDLTDYMHTDGSRDNYSKIKKMIKYLDEGKVLDVYMYFQGGFGHAINIYGYSYNSLGEVIFDVYDSNLPQNKRSGFTLNHDKCYLEVKRIENENGPDTFEYLYWPLSGKSNISYMATSNPDLMSKNAMVVMDEDWNVVK